MEKVIIIPEKEYRELIPRIINDIWEFSQKGYGCKFICRETKKEMTKESVYGYLLIPLQRIFKEI